MKTKNKILVILASFILLLLLFNSKAFAAENQVLKNIPTDIPYYEKWFPQLPKDTQIIYIVNLTDSKLPLIYYSTEKNVNFVISVSNSNSKNYDLKLMDKEFNKSYDFGYIQGSDNAKIVANQQISCRYVDNDSLYTSADVYKKIDNGYEVVFQAPPQGLEAVLEEGYQTAQVITTQSITQQLGVLVPVGIVIMATIILVFLIKSFHFWRP